MSALHVVSGDQRVDDRFFDGVDFSQALSQEDIDDLLADSLRNGTTAVEGSIY